MKTLYIMRHGKAEEAYDKADYKRKLVSKGIKRSQKTAQRLLKNNEIPQLILCSNACRALDTAKVVAEELSIAQEHIQAAKELYLAPVSVLMDSFYAMDNILEHVLVVGHNPGLSELVTHLSGELIDWMPTSSLFALSFDTDKWEEINTAKSTIAFSVFPKK